MDTDDLLARTCAEIAGSPEPGYVKDSQLRYLAVSPAYAALWGLEPGELVGRATPDAADAEPGGNLTERDEKERRSLVFGRSQTLCLRGAKDERGVLIHIRRLRLPDGRIFIVGRDWKQQRQAAGLSADASPTPVGSDLPAVEAGKSRIVVVAGDAAMRDDLSGRVAAWGFDGCAVADGEEAVAVRRAARAVGSDVDLAVIDVGDHRDFARLRSFAGGRPSADLPVVLLAPWSAMPGESVDMPANIRLWLCKPAPAARLHAAVLAGLVPDAADAGAAAADDDRAAARPPAGSAPDAIIAVGAGADQIVFGRVLEQIGLKHRTVSTGDALLEAYAERVPAVVLIDVCLPRIDALQTARAIRALEADRALKTPIIGITDATIENGRARCLEAGMDEHLMKPVSPRRLGETIRRRLIAYAARDRA